MKAVITKSQFDRIKNFINETKEVKKDEVVSENKKSFPDLTGDGKITKADILKGRGVIDEKKKRKPSEKQLRTFDVDNDGDIEGDDLKDLRAMKKVDKSLDEKKYSDKASSFIGKEISHLMRDKGYPHDRAVAAAINVAKEKGMKVGKKQMDEDSDCGCGADKDDTRYMFFSNLEQMMRQARMLLQMDEDMLEDLLNNGHDWAADHIAEAKNNMDQVFDFIMGEMHGEGEDESWHNEKEMIYEGIQIGDEVDVINRGGKYKSQMLDWYPNTYLYNAKITKINGNKVTIRKYWGDNENQFDEWIVDINDVDGLNEGMQLKKKVQTSKELKHHLDKNIPLHESEFRYGSPKHIQLLKEVKELYNKGLISLNETDEFIINEFNPNPVKIKGIGEVYLGLIQEDYESDEELLSEAVYQGRKVQLGKRMRGKLSGKKKFYVFVRNPKTGKVKKITFGQKGVKIKKNNPERRRSFRARHKCSQQKDRLSAAYWSCRAW